jgi:adenine deaminase
LALSRSGLEQWTGAVATTVSHDTHNLVVFGKGAEDLAAAANALIESGGGMAVARQGRVVATLALPVAGLLSDRPIDELAAEQKRLQKAAFEVGTFATDKYRRPIFSSSCWVRRWRVTRARVSPTSVWSTGRRARGWTHLSRSSDAQHLARGFPPNQIRAGVTEA